jgi:tungstate transport system substrate-binding protein
MSTERHSSRLRALAALTAALLLLAGCGGDDGGGASGAGEPAAKGQIILATTTSTQDSGLLDELIPRFERESGYTVKTVAVGSGQALELGERGEADVLLVHSPKAEEELMDTGTAGERRLVMHNDFVLVGPSSDPAGIEGETVEDAFAGVARGAETFVSRGDDSGTNARELELWDAAGVDPEGSWYEKTGQGMGATLRIAAEKQGYTLADRGTYLATAGPREDLDILVEGDAGLLNVYHVIEMTRKAGSRVQEAGARAFARWIVSRPVQQSIGEFGRRRFGEPLFTPDAGKQEAELAAGG